MLATAGFGGISTVWQEAREEHWGRLCVHAVASGSMERDRLLARKPRLMSVNGGNRGGRGGRAKRNADS
jgi:hypothetical protein